MNVWTFLEWVSYNHPFGYYSYLRMIPKESLDLEKSFIIFIMDLLAKKGFQTQINAYFLETDFWLYSHIHI